MLGPIDYYNIVSAIFLIASDTPKPITRDTELSVPCRK